VLHYIPNHGGVQVTVKWAVTTSYVILMLSLLRLLGGGGYFTKLLVDSKHDSSGRIHHELQRIGKETVVTCSKYYGCISAS
jgi:hypothetical protein